MNGNSNLTKRKFATSGSRKALHPAAFLDRDGTITRHVGYVSHPDQLELLPGAARAIRALNESGVLAIVITNQPVAALGLCDAATLEQIHARLESLLESEGASLNGIYFCPHHAERDINKVSSHEEEPCACRKPQTGLVERAVSDLRIDLRRSAVFGDSWRDVELAHRIRIPAYLVGGESSLDALDAYAAENLEAAVTNWLQRLDMDLEYD